MLRELITGGAARVGTSAATFVLQIGSAIGQSQQAFNDAVETGLSKAADVRREHHLQQRSDRLGITKGWYNEIADEYGEELLIEADLAKSASSGKSPLAAYDKNSMPWKGLTEDPFEPVAAFGGWREKPAVVSYDMLELIARRVVPYTAFLQLRMNQISTYCDPQKDQHGPGFVIRLRDDDDEEIEQDEDDEKKNLEKKDHDEKQDGLQDKRAKQIEKAVLACGFSKRKDDKTGDKRDGFLTFSRKALRDWLICDQLNIEKQRDRAGKLVAWRVIDCKTVRHASKDSQVLNERGERVKYAQIVTGTVAAEFSENDLSFCIRNPRSDLRVAGYGFSEVEMMVSTMTALLNGFEHNSRYFAQGTTAKGVLSVHGLIPRNQIRAFRRRWISMVTGAANAWRTPVLVIPDEKSKVQWVDIQKSNMDMEFSSWLDWLIRSVCAVLQVSPDELGYQMGNLGQSGGLGEGNQADKIQASKDKGLRPLLRQYAQALNEEIVWRIDDRYELAFVGMDASSESAEVELLAKECKGWKTINEARKARNLPERDDCDVIDNQIWLQMKQQEQMQQEQGGQEAQGGFGDIDGFGGFGDWDKKETEQQPEEVAKSLTRRGRVRKLKSNGISTYEIDF